MNAKRQLFAALTTAFMAVAPIASAHDIAPFNPAGAASHGEMTNKTTYVELSEIVGDIIMAANDGDRNLFMDHYAQLLKGIADLHPIADWFDEKKWYDDHLYRNIVEHFFLPHWAGEGQSSENHDFRTLAAVQAFAQDLAPEDLREALIEARSIIDKMRNKEGIGDFFLRLEAQKISLQVLSKKIEATGLAILSDQDRVKYNKGCNNQDSGISSIYLQKECQALEEHLGFEL